MMMCPPAHVECLKFVQGKRSSHTIGCESGTPLSILVFRSTVTRKIPLRENRVLGSKRYGSSAGLRPFANRVIGAEPTIARGATTAAGPLRTKPPR
jgi:hypothetical protein